MNINIFGHQVESSDVNSFEFYTVYPFFIYLYIYNLNENVT